MSEIYVHSLSYDLGSACIQANRSCKREGPSVAAAAAAHTGRKRTKDCYVYRYSTQKRRSVCAFMHTWPGKEVQNAAAASVIAQEQEGTLIGLANEGRKFFCFWVWVAGFLPLPSTYITAVTLVCRSQLHYFSRTRLAGKKASRVNIYQYEVQMRFFILLVGESYQYLGAVVSKVGLCLCRGLRSKLNG